MQCKDRWAYVLHTYILSGTMHQDHNIIRKLQTHFKGWLTRTGLYAILEEQKM